MPREIEKVKVPLDRPLLSSEDVAKLAQVQQ